LIIHHPNELAKKFKGKKIDTVNGNFG
jgi:hypothetical protein